MGLFGGVGVGLAGVSVSAVAVLAFGTVVMLSILGTFLACEKYRRPPKVLSPVEFAGLAARRRS